MYMVEMNMNDPLYVTSSNLDHTFSAQELRNRYFTWPDNIPSKILTYEKLFPILHKTFNLLMTMV